MIQPITQKRKKEEILAAENRTKQFLESAWGIWVGPEYNDIEDMINNHKHSKQPDQI